MRKNAFSGMLSEDIHAHLVTVFPRIPPFVSGQIIKWIAQGIVSFDDMTNLAKELRAYLMEHECVYSSDVIETLEDPDGTVKMQIQLYDGNIIEAVLLTDAENRKTACISSQAGCAMACAFCKTGSLGFSRNLTASEIVEQFYFLEAYAKKTGENIDTIVFMGMGEPLCNLDELRKAIAVLAYPKGRNFSRTRITVSTCGIIDGIYDLADKGPDIRLAVSLTTANEDLRRILMPVTEGNSLAELKKAIAYFAEKTNTRVTLEAVLFANLNTSKESVNELLTFIRGLHVHINLIPWNPVDIKMPQGIALKEPSSKEVHDCMRMIDKAGVSVTLRTRRGRKVAGACGQLGSVAAEE